MIIYMLQESRDHNSCLVNYYMQKVKYCQRFFTKKIKTSIYIAYLYFLALINISVSSGL